MISFRSSLEFKHIETISTFVPLANPSMELIFVVRQLVHLVRNNRVIFDCYRTKLLDATTVFQFAFF